MPRISVKVVKCTLHWMHIFLKVFACTAVASEFLFCQIICFLTNQFFIENSTLNNMSSTQSIPPHCARGPDTGTRPPRLQVPSQFDGPGCSLCVIWIRISKNSSGAATYRTPRWLLPEERQRLKQRSTGCCGGFHSSTLDGYLCAVSVQQWIYWTILMSQVLHNEHRRKFYI